MNNNPTPRRVDVVHVTDSLNAGGAERVLVELVNGLHDAGVSVAVCVTRDGMALAPELPRGIEVLRLKRKHQWDIAPIRRFIRYCNSRGVKLLHAHGRGSLRFCALVKLLGGAHLKLISHDHYGLIGVDTAVPPLMGPIARTLADRYIGVSPALRDWAIENLQLPPAKVELIGNAIDLRRFANTAPLERASLGEIKQPLLAVVAANMRPQKDHPLLLRALAASKLAREKLHLLVVGLDLQDDYSRECHGLVNSLGLGENVTFLGSRTDIPSVLGSADFGLLSSKSETGPVTLLEYMAAGLPFLVTRSGQIAETVEEQGIPYFVPPQDEAAYAAALDELVELSPQRRADLGAQGREIVARLFDIKTRIAQVLTIYKQLGVHPRSQNPKSKIQNPKSKTPTRLGIISDALHYYDEQGRLCALSPVVRQFEQWAAIFPSVTVCAPLLTGPVPSTHSPYTAKNIRLLPIPNAGGNSPLAKAGLALKMGQWWGTLNRLLRHVDAVHIRCPNNISILGLLALNRYNVYRQAVFTGNWLGYEGEPPTYRWQRWYLKNLFRGPVAVYGEWPDQPPNIVPTFSPPYGMNEWNSASDDVAARVARLRGLDRLQTPIRLISVGALTANKNQQLVVEAVKLLRDAGVEARLDILGEGEMRGALEQKIAELGLGDRVFLNGSTPAAEVRRFYGEADFVIQPSLTEGFSKVPVEALFHGALPLLSDLPLNIQIVAAGERGRTFAQGDAPAIAEIVAELAADPARMATMVENGREYVRSLTLESWREHIRLMLETHWGVELGAVSGGKKS